MKRVNVVGAALAFVAFGCGGASDGETICEAVEACVATAGEFDMAACVGAVEDAPSGVVEECAACVEDKTCSELGPDCEAQCAGLDLSGSQTGSGLPGDALITDLTASEATALCEYTRSLYPTEPIDCGDFTYELSANTCATAGNNLPPSGCEATVADGEACAAAIAANVCTDTLPAACAPLAASSCQN